MRLLQRLILVVATSLTAVFGPLASAGAAADLTIHIDRARYVDYYTVEISGTITCPVVSGADVIYGYVGSLRLAQIARPNRLIASGYSELFGECTGEPEPFLVTVNNESGIAFVRGRSLLTGSVDTYSCNYDEEGGECFPVETVDIHRSITVR